MPISTIQAADYSYKKLVGVGFTSASYELNQEFQPNGTTNLTSPLTVPNTNVRIDASKLPKVVAANRQPTNAAFSGPLTGEENYLDTTGTTWVPSDSPYASPAAYYNVTLTSYSAPGSQYIVYFSSELRGAIPSTFTSGSDYAIQLTRGSGETLIPTGYGYFIDTDSGVVIFTNPAAATDNGTNTIKARFFKYQGRYLSDVLTSTTATITGSFTGSFQGLFYNPDGTPFSGGGGGASGGVGSVISSSFGAYVSASGYDVIVSASSFQVTASTIVLSGSLTSTSPATFSNTTNQFTGSFSGSFSGISTDAISSGDYKVQVYSGGTIQATGSLILSGSSHQITGSVSAAGQIVAQSLYTNAISSSGTVYVSGTVAPDGNQINNLGTVGNQWNAVYAKSGSFGRVGADTMTATSASFGRVDVTNISYTTQESSYVSSSFLILSSGSSTTQATNGLLVQIGSQLANGLLFAVPETSLQPIYGSSNRWGYSSSIDLQSTNTSRNVNILPFMRIETSFNANTPAVLGKGDFMMVSQSDGSIDLYIYA